eukprot:822736-Heterocapsa_arctica.AAC.1
MGISTTRAAQFTAWLETGKLFFLYFKACQFLPKTRATRSSRSSSPRTLFNATRPPMLQHPPQVQPPGHRAHRRRDTSSCQALRWVPANALHRIGAIGSNCPQ